MNIYTIGFTQKSAEKFFKLLEINNVRSILDIRLNNSSQLAGFTKGIDLEYFLSKLLNIKYYHNIQLSPTKSILDDYKKKKITWEEYEYKFIEILKKRNIKDEISSKYYNDLESICLLCSEPTADKCHRRLVADQIRELFPELDINIIHI